MDIRKFFTMKKKTAAPQSNSTEERANPPTKAKKASTASSAPDDVIEILDDSETTVSSHHETENSGSIKRKKYDEPKKDKVDISAQDFFAKSSSSTKPTKKPRRELTKEKKKDAPKRPKLVDILETENEEDDGYEQYMNPVNKSKGKKRAVVDVWDDDDEDFTDKKKTKPKTKPKPTKRIKAPSPPKPPKKQTTRKRSPSSSRRLASKPKRDDPLEPTLRLQSFSVDDAAPECLSGYTFVFSGVLETMSRDDSIDYVKMLGGRVTTAVSSRTDYLVVGEMLEDGRPYTDGSKYKKATDLKVIVVEGDELFYGLCKQYSDKIRPNPTSENIDFSTEAKPDAKNQDESTINVAPRKTGDNSARSPGASSSNPYAKHSANPYAKKPSNPYANPYAKKTQSPTNATTTNNTAVPHALWADKHAPQSTRDILGNQESVKKLVNWLARWEGTFNTSKAQGKTYSSPGGPWKAALLSGPPGIGKTTTATLVVKESGRDAMELNASDVRSKKALTDGLGDVTGSHVIDFKQQNGAKRCAVKRRCIIMDEVDGMGAGDRSGMAELIKMIKGSMVPIICICNDRQSQKVRSLAPYCLDLKFHRPTKAAIGRRAVRIGQQEGLAIEQNAAVAVAESCGNDIRQVLNCLQMWANNREGSAAMTYKQVKERQGQISKDEILRVSIFDATQIIVEGRRGLKGDDPVAERDSLFKRGDAFFVDYSLMGLNVHQNYLKVMVGQYSEAKRSNDETRVGDFLERMHEGTMAMSDFAVAEGAIRGIDQNWSLLPLSAMLAVKAGYHAGGEKGGFLSSRAEFTSWMGKNSTRGRKQRILQGLAHHMNYRVSGDSRELRLAYLPVLRERLLGFVSSGSETSKTIGWMDDYGLNRDDLFEGMDEFKMNSKAKSFSDLDSKQKAAFTRAYNEGVHKSQALVAEQGGEKRSKRAKSTSSQTIDPDAVDDDPIEEEEEEEEDMDPEKLRALFKVKKSGRTPAKRKSSGGKKKR